MRRRRWMIGTATRTAILAVFVVVWLGLGTGAFAATTVSTDNAETGQALVIEADRRITSFNQPEIDLVIAGRVTGSVRAANVELRQGGYVGGHVDVSPAGSADIDGRVAGDVVAKEIKLGPQAVIDGSIVHLGGALSISPTAVYNSIRSTQESSNNLSRSRVYRYDTDLDYTYHYGDGSNIFLREYAVPFTNPPIFVPVPQRGVTQGNSHLASFLLWLGFLIGMACLLVLVMIFFRPTAAKTVDITEHEPGRALLVGFLGLILLPVVMAVVAVTIVGITLLPIIVITFILALVVGIIGEGIFLGRKIGGLLPANWGEDDFKAGLLGLFALLHLVFVPVVGWAVMLILGLLGYGAVLIQWYPLWRARWRKRGQSVPDNGDVGGER